MSDADAPGDDVEGGALDVDRDLSRLEDAISACHKKITRGRIRNPEHERVRLQQYRALAYMLQTRTQIESARELEELSDRLDDIEAGIERERERRERFRVK